MAYDNTSTHPVTQALIRQSGDDPENADAGDLAEQLERIYHTDDTDISALYLPNTTEVHVRDDDGTISIYNYDADATGTADGIITDADGRKFVIAQVVLTQTAYDALSVKHPTTLYFITDT